MPPLATRSAAGNTIGAPELPTINMEVAPADKQDATDDDMWAVPDADRVVVSFPFLDWSPTRVGGKRMVTRTSMMGLILAIIFWQPDAATTIALEGASVIMAMLTITCCIEVLTEVGRAGLLGIAYRSERVFLHTLAQCAGWNARAVCIRVEWIDFGDDFDRSARPAVARRGTRPATPAVPGRPGPDVLHPFNEIKWGDCLKLSRQLSPEDPSLILRRLMTALGSREREATRHSPSSRVYQMAELIGTHAASFGQVDAASVTLPRAIQRYVHAAATILPAEVAGSWDSSAQCETEILDAHVALGTSKSIIEQMLWRRIHLNLEEYSALAPFKGHTAGVGNTRQLLEFLAMGFCPSSLSALPTTLAAVLNQELVRRQAGPAIADYLAGGSDAQDVAITLLQQHEAVSTTGGGSTSTGGSASSAAGSTDSGTISQKAVERVMSSTPFRTAHEQSMGKPALDRLTTGLLSGVALILRYLFFATAWLPLRHEYFASLMPCLDEREAYLSRAAVLDADSDEIPAELITYLVGQTVATLFFSLRWAEINMVDMIKEGSVVTGGFLAIRHLRTGSTFSPVIKDDHYLVEACLVGIKGWFNRLLLAVGFSAKPASGYTWPQCVDQQIELVRYIEGLPKSEQTEWRKWARNNFITNCLQRAATLFRHVLESASGDEQHSSFLPDGARFFVLIEQRMVEAAPVVVVRRAFPSLFDTTPLRLAGTAGPERPAKTTSPSATPRAGDKRKLKAAPNGDKGPGSSKSLFKRLKGGLLFVGGDVIDTKGIAKELSLDHSKVCWAVNCTIKTNEQALQVCPSHELHGGMDSDWHQTNPKITNDIVRRFTNKATKNQQIEAGWSKVKRGAP